MHSAAIRRAAVLAAFLVSVSSAQAPPPAPAPAKPVKPDEVVATVNGEKITAGMLQRLRNGAAQQFQQATQQSNKDFLKSVAGLLVLSRLGEQEKLDQQEPYRDQYAFLRLNFLANAYLSHLNTKVSISQKQIQEYYEKNQGEFSEAHVRAIYIAFSRSGGEDAQGRKRLTEAEAKAKAEKLVAVLKTGADFAQLAKENSDDSPSAEKGGQINPVKQNSTGVPTEIRQAIFALEPGKFTEPVPQPAGYYIFKLDKIQKTPFEEAASNIATTLQTQQVRAEMQRILGSVDIQHLNDAFFAAASPPPPPVTPTPPIPSP